jgi:hypothetical protein
VKYVFDDAQYQVDCVVSSLLSLLALTHLSRMALTMSQETPWYMKDDGSLDMDKLLSAFQDFSGSILRVG